MNNFTEYRDFEKVSGCDRKDKRESFALIGACDEKGSQETKRV